MGRARRAASQLRGLTLVEVYAAWRRRPVRSDVILYESFWGKGMLCNPEAIFHYLRHNSEFARFTHVWAVQDPKRFRGAYSDDPRVRFVKYRSPAYFKYLATAGYLINNVTFPAEFGKRPGQVYLNTWHGTPLKKMGFSVPDGTAGAQNVVRNFLAADYLLSSSGFMTDQMYAGDYRLRNIYRGRIIEEGQPRTDRQYLPDAGAVGRSVLADRGLPVAGKHVLLYAPTWRGEHAHEQQDDTAALADTVSHLKEAVPDGWVVLVKAHQAAYDAAAGSRELSGTLVPNDIPTNIVLSVADHLVTDYSSVLFDYLPLDRPITFFVPDLGDYSVSRGLHFTASELPGETVADTAALERAVIRATASGSGEDPHRAARHEWRDRFVPHDDGRATERVVDVVFRGQRNHRLVDVSSDGRERILIYLGQMRPNGISNSALNLLSNIDHDRFDVSCIYDTAHATDESRNTVAAIDQRVRPLPRIVGSNGSILAHARRQLMQRTQVSQGVEEPSDLPVAELFANEWTRCFGDAEFDYIVDFNGYGSSMDFILLHGAAKSRSIWLHNDMQADARREVHGKRKLYRQLHSVFSTYRFFDNLVSVSTELCRVNSDQLAGYAPASSFTYAHNTVNHERVRKMALEAGPLPGRSQSEPDPDAADEITFITLGRLSTEKNHERLIRAFAVVHSESPGTRLLIVGGGPLHDHLREVIDSLHLADCVELLGFMANPYPVLRQSDCFLLSSDHEGQPMVILEALTLGIPVVITAFSSSAGALPPHTGLIVERSVEGLVSGMRSFLAHEVPSPEFDPAAYNRTAMAEFNRAIGADPRPAKRCSGPDDDGQT